MVEVEMMVVVVILMIKQNSNDHAVGNIFLQLVFFSRKKFLFVHLFIILGDMTTFKSFLKQE